MRIAKQVHDVTGARVPTWQRLKAAVRGSQEEKGALCTKQDRDTTRLAEITY